MAIICQNKNEKIPKQVKNSGIRKGDIPGHGQHAKPRHGYALESSELFFEAARRQSSANDAVALELAQASSAAMPVKKLLLPRAEVSRSAERLNVRAVCLKYNIFKKKTRSTNDDSKWRNTYMNQSNTMYCLHEYKNLRATRS
jgi:hypothetical protein